MKIIRIIGTSSGTGKTHFISNAIKLLKKHLNYETAVIKNIHEHEIDERGKDSYKYCEAGAVYSVTKNINNENTIFLKKKIEIEDLINWLDQGPFKIDIFFIEGFKNLNYPSVLCVKDFNEIEDKLGKNIKMISGLICKKNDEIRELEVPIVDIEKDFEKFLNIFNIK